MTVAIGTAAAGCFARKATGVAIVVNAIFPRHLVGFIVVCAVVFMHRFEVGITWCTTTTALPGSDPRIGNKSSVPQVWAKVFSSLIW